MEWGIAEGGGLVILEAGGASATRAKPGPKYRMRLSARQTFSGAGVGRAGDLGLAWSSPQGNSSWASSYHVGRLHKMVQNFNALRVAVTCWTSIVEINIAFFSSWQTPHLGDDKVDLMKFKELINLMK
jgi:hypothetical protein